MKSKREWLRSRKPSDRVDGFTLVELLVVITIIDILMAMIMPVAGAAIRKAWIGVCASNLSQVLSMTVLYASDNGGYIMPSGKTGHANLTYDMGAGQASSKGNKGLHCHGSIGGNYVDGKRNQDYYSGYDKDWQNYRSAWIRQSWNSESEDPALASEMDGLEGSGVDGNTKPDRTRLKLGDIPTGSVLFAEDFSGHWRMSEAHVNNVNIGFISGGVSLRHYDPNAYPFKNMVDRSTNASQLKTAYRWLEGKTDSDL